MYFLKEHFNASFELNHAKTSIKYQKLISVMFSVLFSKHGTIVEKSETFIMVRVHCVLYANFTISDSDTILQDEKLDFEHACDTNI